MSQALSDAANSIPNDRPDRKQKLEGRLLNFRVVIDALLVCGGAIVGFSMLVPAREVFPFDSSSINFLWAVVALACCALIVGVTCKHVSRSTRTLTSVLLALILLSLTCLNFLLAWLAPNVLTQLVELQWFIWAYAAWAVICLGLMSIESRIEDSLARPSELKTSFSTVTALIRAGFYFKMGVLALAVLLYPFVSQHVWSEQCASTWWPVTEAKLVEPKEDSRSWLRYEYNVDGVDYIGKREVTFFKPTEYFSVSGNPQQRVAELKSQGSFPVAYNPTNPEASVLNPGVSNLMLLCFWASTIYILFLPVDFRLLQATYTGNSKEDLGPFYSFLVFLAFVGFALGLIALLLTSLVSLPFDWAAILLVIGIWSVYRLCKWDTEKSGRRRPDRAD